MKAGRFNFLKVLFFVPFFIGVAGYLMNGNTILESLHGSIAMYCVNVVTPGTNSLIWFARMTALMATASGIIYVLRGILAKFYRRIMSFYKKTVVVYCEPDNLKGRMTAKSIKHGILAVRNEQGMEFFPHAHNHVLMFRNDWDNLEFYQIHQEDLEGKNVHMKLENTDSFLLRESRITYFNPSEVIAATYWRDRDLIRFAEGRELDVDVAIIGFGKLGQNILTAGLMVNVYFPNQSIRYHVFGDSSIYESIHDGLDLINDDSIIYYHNDWSDNFNLLMNMDRIVITVDDASNTVQSLLHLCTKTEIDFYNPDNLHLDMYYKADNLYSFGKMDEVFTGATLENRILFQQAKKLYFLRHHPEDKSSGAERRKAENRAWVGLDGFTRASYLAIAEYHTMRRKLFRHLKSCGMRAGEEELVRLEHLRWSRFYFLNHWSGGESGNDGVKDFDRKIDERLVPFDELKEQDRENICERVRKMADVSNMFRDKGRKSND